MKSDPFLNGVVAGVALCSAVGNIVIVACGASWASAAVSGTLALVLIARTFVFK